jgi:hypothetical protein
LTIVPIKNLVVYIISCCPSCVLLKIRARIALSTLWILRKIQFQLCLWAQ